MKLFSIKKEKKKFKDVPDKNADLDPTYIAHISRLKEIEETVKKQRMGGVFVYGASITAKDIRHSGNDLRKTLREHTKVNEMLKLHYVLKNIEEGKHPNVSVNRDVEDHLYDLEQSLKAHSEITDFLVSTELKKKKTFNEMI